MATRRQNAQRQMVTLPWREDAGILRRLELVAALYHQPLGQIWRTVNQRLALGDPARGLAPAPPVSYETIKTDRERVRELATERIVGNVKEHLTTLQLARAAIERDIISARPGSSRAPLYALLIHITEDMAKLDGSWMGDVTPPADERDFLKGPAPQELLAAGKITITQYRSVLQVIAVRAPVVGGSQDRGDVIEGESRPVKVRRLPAPKPPAPAPPVRANGSHTFDGGRIVGS